MESSRPAAHILVLPFPAQGHINPMLQFAKRLSFKGLRVTFVNSSGKLSSKSIKASETNSFSVNIEDISDQNSDRDELMQEQTHDNFLQHVKSLTIERLAKVVEKQKNNGYPVHVIVYDSIMPWILDIAHELGVQGAPFFTYACALWVIYYHHYKGTLNIPTAGWGDDETVRVDSLPELKRSDLPSYISDFSSYPHILDLLMKQYPNLMKADWLFVNSFDKLEDNIIKWIGSQWKMKTIGPNIPSIYLDKQLKDDTDYGLNLFEPDHTSSSITKWLDSKPIGSVVYVAFGSLATLSEKQMKELSYGLVNSNCYFFRVVRDSEENKLPLNFKLDISYSGKGFILNWCSQLEVLAHPAVGCFMTHCGWNSILEALSLGVPMVAMPNWTDQMTNAKFIVDVWRTGVRVKVDHENGTFVGRQEIERCIKEVMGNEENEFKRNAIKWKDLAKEAMAEDGSSDKNIDEFVSQLVHTSTKCVNEI